MVNHLEIADEKENLIQFMPLIESYKMVASLQKMPHLSTLYGEYVSRVEVKIRELQLQLYPDEAFYDGSPNQKPLPITLLPDAYKEDLSQRIGMTHDLQIEELEEIYNKFSIVYIHHETRKIVNPVLSEVW